MIKYKTISKFAFFLFADIVCMCLLSCVPAISFTRAQYSDKGGNYGDITIRNVIDARDVEYGKNEPSRLGTVRGGYGNPWSLNSEKGTTVAEEVKKTIKQALSQSGYLVVENSSPSLDIFIKKFWCDGYMGYKIECSIEIQLIAFDRSTILYKKQIFKSTGFGIVVSYDPMVEAFNDIMNQIGCETVKMVNSQEFLDALKKDKNI